MRKRKKDRKGERSNRRWAGEGGNEREKERGRGGGERERGREGENELMNVKETRNERI